MKFMKRAQIYKASNVTFNPQTFEAFSYRHWRFVAKVDGLIIFNNYRYSNTTSKHQTKVRALLNELNIKIDIEAPYNLGISHAPIEQQILEAEEGLCNQFLKEELKKIVRAENAKFRREKLQAIKDAEFKKNLESPEFKQAVIEYIASKEQV